MATVYSLICWGGYTGSATWGRTGNQLTKTNHGARSGMVVYFSGGTLPTSSPQVNTTTPYYVKVISTSAIELYTDAGLTTQVTFSATGSGWVLKSQAVIDPATFFAFCGLSDLSRWDAGGGSYRIYDGLAGWNTARTSLTSAFDIEVCEICEAFNYTGPAAMIDVNMPCALVQITTRVNNIWSSAYSHGDASAGFVLIAAYSYGSILQISNINSLVEGFSIIDARATYQNTRLLNLAGANSVARYMMVGNTSGTISGSTYAIQLYGSLTAAVGCVVFGCLYGIYVYQYTSLCAIKNCTAVKNKTGIGCGNTGSANGNKTTVYNTVSIGNETENWYSYLLTNLQAASNNAGGTGEAWMTTGGTRVEITEASPFTATFVDFANNDFRPAVGSQLIDAGVEYYGILPTDIAGDEVPNYNNGGTEAPDIGAYEYDHGYGTRPASGTISLTSIVSGTRVLITRDDTGAVLYNGVPGTSLSFNTTYIGAFSIRARNASSSPSYREFVAGGVTVASQTIAIKLLQQLDE